MAKPKPKSKAKPTPPDNSALIERLSTPGHPTTQKQYLLARKRAAIERAMREAKRAGDDELAKNAAGDLADFDEYPTLSPADGYRGRLMRPEDCMLELQRSHWTPERAAYLLAGVPVDIGALEGLPGFGVDEWRERLSFALARDELKAWHDDGARFLRPGDVAEWARTRPGVSRVFLEAWERMRGDDAPRWARLHNDDGGTPDETPHPPANKGGRPKHFDDRQDAEAWERWKAAHGSKECHTFQSFVDKYGDELPDEYRSEKAMRDLKERMKSRKQRRAKT